MTKLVELLERSEGLRGHSALLGSTAEEGQATHRSIQERLCRPRKSAPQTVETEVAVSWIIAHRERSFQISGRIDVLVTRQSDATAYEIKSCDSIARIHQRLAADPNDPAAFQAGLYALLLERSRNIPCTAAVVLASITGSSKKTITLRCDHATMEERVRALLDLQIDDEHLAQITRRRRQSLAKRLEFPYSSTRDGQAELMTAVAAALKREEPIMVSAPTGSGKTMAALVPTLRKAASDAGTVVVATARNSQKESFGKAVRDLNARRNRTLAIVLASRETLCTSQGNERVCSADICRFAASHHVNVRRSRVLKSLGRSGAVLTAAELRRLATHLVVCPFELSLELAQQADVVACDYNQVFSPVARIARLFETRESRAAVQLIVDEAHNLPERLRTLCSSELMPGVLVGEVTKSHARFFRETNAGLLKLMTSFAEPAARRAPDHQTRADDPIPFSRDNVAIELTPTGDRSSEVHVDARVLALVERLRAITLASFGRLQRALPDLPFDDPARLRFQQIEEFCRVLANEAFGRQSPYSMTITHSAEQHSLNILCKDAAAFASEQLADLRSPLFMSATLDPVTYFAQKLGIDPSKHSMIRQGNHFPKYRRRLFIVPQLSTLFRLRSVQTPKIAKAVSKILALQPVNTFVFAPSFALAAELTRLCALPPDWTVHLQTPRMPDASVIELLAHFRDSQQPQVLFGVMRGSLSEGIDLPGRSLQSVIIVGPCLPRVSLEQSLLETYESSRGRDGFDEAAVVPAMVHVNQALGRLIRSPEDIGTCFLLDRRFMSPAYFERLAPEWRSEHPLSHVSTTLAADISSFWRSVSGVPRELSSQAELG